jgi:hypothetical protein
MKLSAIRQFILVITGMVFLTDAAARTWTRKDGKVAEGELVAKNETAITLLLRNKTKVQIPINSLNLEDQLFVKDWTPKRPINVTEDAIYHDGSWFAVVLEKLKWRKAAQKADKLGGHLAQVKDAETQKVVSELAEGLLLWLDGSDEKVEGLWKWSNGEKLPFTNWSAGEPTNSSLVEHYIVIGAEGKWNDVSGKSDLVPGFIVQWDD